jgi:hypothetical protein
MFTNLDFIHTIWLKVPSSASRRGETLPCCWMALDGGGRGRCQMDDIGSMKAGGLVLPSLISTGPGAEAPSSAFYPDGRRVSGLVWKFAGKCSPVEFLFSPW